MKDSFWSRHAGAILAVGLTMALQIIGGLIVAGMILQQIADLHKDVQDLQRIRSDQQTSLVRSETRLDGIDVRLASMESLIRQLVQQKLGMLP